MIRILLALFACGNLSLISASEPQRPNVVIIYTDDQGYGDVSSMNAEAKFQTPNYDRLAREGISFTNAHSSDTVCTPSRYGLLTGRYAWRTRLKKGVMGSEGKCLISDDTLTVPSLLKSQGYTTAMVGKWHLGMTFDGKPGQRDWSVPIKDMPLDKGFDYYFGIPASLNYGILAWFEGRHTAVPPTKFTAKKANKRHPDYRIKPPYQDSAAETKQVLKKAGIEIAEDFIDNQCLTRFTDQAISWMGDHLKSGASKGEAANPFFLYLPLTSPHYPVCPLPEFHGKGDCGGYGEFMIETDHRIGQVLDFLDQQGIADNTIVIVTSDNGPEKTWQQRIENFDHASNAGFRGGKRDIYEGGHRVPFLVRWPKGISNPGRTSDRLTGQTDIFATLAEVVGQTVPDDAAVDSSSFAKVLKDEQDLQDRAPLINHGVSGRFAVTIGNWKLVMAHRKAKMELYDLSKDSSEEVNVIQQNPDVVNRLQAELTQIVCKGRTTEGASQGNDTGYWDDLTWITREDYDQFQEGENNE